MRIVACVVALSAAAYVSANNPVSGRLSGRLFAPQALQIRKHHCSLPSEQRSVAASVLKCCSSDSIVDWFCRWTNLCPRCAGVVHLGAPAAPEPFLQMQNTLETANDIHNYVVRYEGSLPDIQGARHDRCDLFPTATAYVFQDEGINTFLAQLFGTIASCTKKHPEIPNVHLTRYDLFHAHLFRASDDRGQLGLLFHAKEFPALCKEFPYHLGYCQHSSTMQIDSTGMDWRNFLWYQDHLAALDLSEGSRLLKCLVPEWLEPLRTTYEGDFGVPVGDVYYFPKGLPGSCAAPSSSLPGVVLFFPRTSPP